MNNKNGFKLSLIFFSLLVFLVSTGGALGVVWLRQQISRTAENCIAKEKELAVLQRRNIYLQSTIAQVHNPEYLKERVGGKLSVPSKKQIVWVNPAMSKDQSRYVAAKLKGNQVMAIALNGSQYNRVVR
jgi:hypothetical protein